MAAGRWDSTLPISLGDGGYELQVVATDNVGRTTILNRNIVIDTSSPDLTVESPVDTELVDSNSYTISGKISDNGGVGVSELQYSRDNTVWIDIPIAGLSWFVAGVDFSSPIVGEGEAIQGARTLYIRASDGLNPEVVQTINFNYDTEDPVISETLVNTDVEKIGHIAVDLAGQASDSNALTSLELIINNGVPSSLTIDADGPDNIPGNGDDNSWSYNHPDTTDGSFALIIRATDAAGRTTEVERNLLIDTTDPAAPVISSSPGNYVTTSLSVTGTATDVTSGISLIEYSIDGESTWNSLSGTNNWFGAIDISSESVGSKTVYLRSTDRAGNISPSASQAYIIDRDNPVLTVNGFSVYEYRDATFTINGNMDDRDLGLSPVSVTTELDSVPIDLSGYPIFQNTDSKTWSQDIPIAPGDNGNCQIVITATDAVGRIVTETIDVGIDTTDPTVAVTTDFSSWFGSNTVLVEGTAFDDGSLLKEIQYSYDNLSWNFLASSTPWSGYVSIPSGETNPLHIRSVDNVGKASTVSTLNVKVDTTGPVTSMVSPLSLSKLNGASDLSIQILVQDIGQSGVISGKVKVNNTDFSSPDTERILLPANAEFDDTWTLTLPAASIPGSEGQMDVNVEFVDIAGNRTIQSFPILVDRTNPSIPIISSHSDSDTVNKTITVSGSATDTQGLDSVSLEIYNENTTLWEPLTVTGTYSWTANINTVTYDTGDYDTDGGTAGTQIRLRCTASDAAGNAASTNRDLTIDQNSDRPVVTINNLDTSGIDTLKLSRTIYGSLTDDDGIGTFEISEDNSAWTSISLSGSAWQYDVSAANGTKNLYFRVIDSAGLTFATNESDEPRVIGDAAGEISDIMTFRLDTVTPEINSVITADRYTPFDFVADTAAVTTNMPFGGNSSHFALKVLASDANTIGSVVINIPGLGDIPTIKGPDETGYETYTTSELDISALGDGTVDMVVTVTDDSGLTSTAIRTILLDNTAPDITYLSPRSSLDIVNGDIPVRGLASDGGSALETVEYKYGYNFNDQTWQSVGGSLFNWEIDFSGVNKIDYYAGLEVESVNTNGTISLTSHGYINDTPVWVGATSLPTGLSSSLTYYIVEATADTFKLATTTGGAAVTYAVVGTEVRVSQFSKDSNGDSIWELPVIVRATDFAGNSSVVSDSTYVVLVDPSGDKPNPVIVYPDPSNLNRIMGGIIRIFGTAEDDDGVDSVYIQIDVDGDDDFDAADIDSESVDWYNGGEGVAVTGTASWNININSNGEFNPVSGTRPINFRVRVKDIYGTYGPWSDVQRIEVDNSVPKIGSTEAPTLTQGATIQNYVSDMYIRGNWVLEGTIEDESDISDIQITGDIMGSLLANPSWFTDYSGTGTDGYRMQIPINTSGTGLYVFTVTAVDNSDPKTNNSATFRINYDNTAPTLGPYDGQLPVEQSNKTYRLTSAVNEGGSGLERVAFYFLRQGVTNAEDRIYNPMEDKAGDANRTYLNHTYGGGSTITFVDSLPRLMLTGVTRADEYTLQHNDIIGNTNVRKGGLVKIGGIDRLISAVDYGTGEISWTGSVSTSVTDAAIAYALIVDHDIPETPVWNPDNTLASITNDDGDGLIEELSKTGTEYIWDAYIDSKEIPDGPIEIHWVAFDKSGNLAADVVSTQVLNHRPMLASVLLGTDLNGENGVEPGEKVPAYSLLDGSGDNQAVATSASSSADPSPFTAKGETTVEIEVIGGNGALQYEFFEGSGVTNIHGSLQNLRLDDVSPVLPITVTMADFISPEIGEGDKNLVFRIWDSTEETTIGVDSQWAEVTVPMAVDVIDGVSPMAVISPLYWNSETDNSLYNNDKSKGHVEVTGVLDGTDPDVSGQISVRGTAYDDQRIEELYIMVDDMTINTGSTITFAPDVYSLVSEYSSGTWTTTGTLGTDGWSFSATDVSIDQTGHRISWQLDWNTSEITDVADLDKSIKILSRDKGNNFSLFTISGSDADDTTHNLPYYDVDVVPYVTSIERNTTFNTHRTRSGAYSLMRGEAGNTLYGFNLDTVGSLVVDSNKSGAAGTTVAITGYSVDTAHSTITFDSPAALRSGWLRLVVNGVEAVNNLNSNLLVSNSEANSFLSETEFWNDDRYIRSWQSNAGDVFDQSDNPIYPTMSMDTNGTLYSSFSNYSTARVYYSTLTGGSRTSVFFTYDPAEETELVVTGTGEVNILYSANYHGGGAWNNNAGTAGGLYLYDNNARNIDAGRGNQRFYRFELFYHNQMLQQFKNIRAARGTNNRIHSAYYDRLSNSVKYANIQDGENPPGTDNTHEYPWVNLDGSSDGDDTGAYSGGSSVILTGRYENGLVRSTGTDEYLTIAIDEDDYPLVVYSDATDGTLRLARSNNIDPYANADWSVQRIMSVGDDNYGLARDYYSAQVDSSGFLHVIFRNSRGELGYIVSTNNPENGDAYTFGSSVTIDQYGLWADLTLNGTTPYISYLSKVNAYDGIKVAFYDANLDLDGDDTPEGGWETMTAAMNYKSSNIRTSVEAHPLGTGTNWTAAIGYTPGNAYRVVYYIGE